MLKQRDLTIKDEVFT